MGLRGSKLYRRVFVNENRMSLRPVLVGMYSLAKHSAVYEEF